MQLNYWMYFNSTGYSIAAQEYLKSCLFCDPSLNIKVDFFNQITGSGVSKNRQQLFESLKLKKSQEDQIGIYHCIPPLYKDNKKHKTKIGFCTFETINIPKPWINQINKMDFVITPSMFNKRLFDSSGATKPVHVIPHCFDSEMFNERVKANGRYKMFTFMSIGTWKLRKNFEVLIKSFYEAFSNNDNVCLIIKTDKPQELQKTVQRIKRTHEWMSKNTAPIFSDDQCCTFEEIPQIMKKADVYISTSLGEGFGYPPLHAMALGIPIIVPKYGGSLEYALPELSTYIDIKEYKTYPSMDGIPQFNNCIWPVLRISDVASAMRSVYDMYPKEKTKLAYKYVQDNFSYKAVGNKLLKVLNV